MIVYWDMINYLMEGLNHKITRNLVNWLWINVVGEKVWPSIHPLEHKAITVLARKKVEHLGNSLVPPGKMQHFANQDASATLLACLQGPCMQKFHKWLTCTYAKKPLLRVSIAAAAAQKFHFSWEYGVHSQFTLTRWGGRGFAQCQRRGIGGSYNVNVDIKLVSLANDYAFNDFFCKISWVIWSESVDYWNFVTDFLGAYVNVFQPEGDRGKRAKFWSTLFVNDPINPTQNHCLQNTKQSCTFYVLFNE